MRASTLTTEILCPRCPELLDSQLKRTWPDVTEVYQVVEQDAGITCPLSCRAMTMMGK